MREKEQLIEHLKIEGRAVLNADDRRAFEIAERTEKKVLLFGLSKAAGIRASAIQEKVGGISFSLDLPRESLSVDLKVPGRFMVINALAAAAVGHLLEFSAAEIKSGLETFKPAWGRMNIFQTASGIHVIDDTYSQSGFHAGGDYNPYGVTGQQSKRICRRRYAGTGRPDRIIAQAGRRLGCLGKYRQTLDYRRVCRRCRHRRGGCQNESRGHLYRVAR
jgi:hypothetical protein